MTKIIHSNTDASDPIEALLPRRALLLVTGGRVTTAGAVSTKYLLVPNSSDQTTVSSTAQTSTHPFLLSLVVGDVAPTVTGKTAQMRVRATVSTGTAPAVTFTVGLYPLTVSGGNYVIGTVVSSSTAAIASPPANDITTGVSSAFAVPSSGPYALGYILSGTPAAAAVITARLSLYYV